MVGLGVFESTASLGAYTPALAFQIHKLYYENLKSAQHWKMAKPASEKEEKETQLLQ